jgi:PhoPQ-activated pathogenicity-related protein
MIAVTSLFLLASGVLAAPEQRSSAPTELHEYLSKPDASASWKIEAQAERRTTIDLTSQTWQGIPWRHKVVLIEPTEVQAKGTAVLYITGGDLDERDIREMTLVANITGMPVAILFNIPNQPLFDMKEDDLIAHTFEKYLATKDANWPLLFPMTKSALRSMDALVDTQKASSNPIQKFIVTGASKRGWTTWLVGASGDKRIAGIAPMVIDNLNVVQQMPHQLEIWGAYSDMIQDYTRRGLQAKLDTPDGKKLAAMVDPYSYRQAIVAPTLIVNGANDPYWATDATQFYWDDLRQPKWLLTVPNAGHDLGNKIQAIESIGAFARSLGGGKPLPTLRWTVERNSVTFRVQGEGLERLTVWIATSESMDFRKSNWQRAVSEPISPSTDRKPGGIRLAFAPPTDKNFALMGEMRFRDGLRGFSFSTETRLFRGGGQSSRN